MGNIAGKVEAITPIMPELVMGSADLTPSNNTRTKAAEDFTPKTPKGRYVRYGIREHGMAAAMNLFWTVPVVQAMDLPARSSTRLTGSPPSVRTPTSG